jgi:hypothetical protein
MSRITLVSFLIACLCASTALAEIIEIPLPGLLGTYPVDAQNAERTISFQLSQPPTIIHGASFRVSGTTETGTLMCDDVSSVWPTALEASMGASLLDFWWATGDMPFQAGPFL